MARHLLAHGARVRALVREPSSAAGQALAQRGVDVVAGDFGNMPSIAAAMAGVQGVFSVQPLLLGKAPREIEWGRRVADAAAAAGVGHLVYASVLGAGLAPDVPHFASKAVIEQHLRSTGLCFTILQPAAFMENLLRPIVRKGIAKGKLTTPHSLDAPQQLIAIDDIGAVAAHVMLAPTAWAGRTIPLVGDVASTRQMAATLSRVLNREIKPGRLPGIIVRLFLGRDLHRMFRWHDASGGELPHDQEALRDLHPGLKTFEQWCRQNFQ